MPTPSGKHLGRLRDLTDARDQLYGLERPIAAQENLPPYVDWRPDLPPAYDQGELNSCGANAADGLLSFNYPDQLDGFSRLQIYYAARAVAGMQAQDDGVRLRDLMKALQNPGAVPEADWPYVPAEVCVPPTLQAGAPFYKIDKYQRLKSPAEMLHCLAVDGPFILGFDVYESFDSDMVAQTGVMPYPTPDEKLLGGHAVLAVGYDLAFVYNANFQSSLLASTRVGTRALLLRNSWGTDWGLNGYFWMPLDYPDDSSDCWAAIVEQTK